MDTPKSPEPGPHSHHHLDLGGPPAPPASLGTPKLPGTGHGTLKTPRDRTPVAPSPMAPTHPNILDRTKNVAEEHPKNIRGCPWDPWNPEMWAWDLQSLRLGMDPQNPSEIEHRPQKSSEMGHGPPKSSDTGHGPPKPCPQSLGMDPQNPLRWGMDPPNPSEPGHGPLKPLRDRAQSSPRPL